MFFPKIFKYLLVAMLVVILVNPKRWLRQASDLSDMNYWIAIPLFFAIGFYGGFIQMGMGIIFLMITVLVLKFDLIAANALKMVIVLLYTIIVVVIFQMNGMIDWHLGLIVGVGQAVGGFLAAEFAAQNADAHKMGLPYTGCCGDTCSSLTVRLTFWRTRIKKMKWLVVRPLRVLPYWDSARCPPD